jgi:hypothetical protein
MGRACSTSVEMKTPYQRLFIGTPIDVISNDIVI